MQCLPENAFDITVQILHNFEPKRLILELFRPGRAEPVLGAAAQHSLRTSTSGCHLHIVPSPHRRAWSNKVIGRQSFISTICRTNQLRDKDSGGVSGAAQFEIGLARRVRFGQTCSLCRNPDSPCVSRACAIRRRVCLATYMLASAALRIASLAVPSSG